MIELAATIIVLMALFTPFLSIIVWPFVGFRFFGIIGAAIMGVTILGIHTAILE